MNFFSLSHFFYLFQGHTLWVLKIAPGFVTREHFWQGLGVGLGALHIAQDQTQVSSMQGKNSTSSPTPLF